MMATAIASPMARPSPSMIAPITPPRPNGRTTRRITVARLAPSARAASRSATGVKREDLTRDRGDDRHDHQPEDRSRR